jgi:hypothetical protein
MSRRGKLLVERDIVDREPKAAQVLPGIIMTAAIKLNLDREHKIGILQLLAS